MSESKHVVVLGAGPAGYAAAFRSADLGQSVTLVDPALNPGGVCLYRGCIPSKALLHIARLIEEARDASAWGIEFGEPKIDIKRIREFSAGVVSKLTSGLGALSKSRKINYVQGHGSLESPTSMKIEKSDGSSNSVIFDYAVVATGSRPTVIPAFPSESERVMDSTAALALADIPARLLVVGGGYIGLELATVYAALGSEVTVVEMLPQLLPGADPDLVKILAKRLDSRLDAILLETRVTEMKDTGQSVEVTFEGKDVAQGTQVFDKALVSVGRRPNSEDLGLQNTAVQLDDDGFITTDEQKRTAEPTIFAVGDIAGNPMLAHKGTHEAHVAAEVIAGDKVRFAPRAIPAVVFTDPEIAWCGLTETEAKETGTAYRASSFPWAASGRAATMERSEGVTKILFDPETRQVLGVGIAGSGAGELIAEGVLAVEMGCTADDLALTIHSHPTLSETVMESAELFQGHCDHFYKPRR
jgi:dihydrolipoamide dehydrogenase